MVAWEKNLESQRHSKLVQPKVRVAVNILHFYSGGDQFEPRSGLAYTHTCFHIFIHFLQANTWRVSRVVHKRCLKYDFQFINTITCQSVTIDGVWICNWSHWPLTDPWLQETIALSLIHILYNSLQNWPRLISLCCLFTSRYLLTVPFTLISRSIPVPQLPASHSNSSQRLNCSSPLTHSLTHQLTSLT
jgi:uncharacterized membrane protein